MLFPIIIDPIYTDYDGEGTNLLKGLVEDPSDPGWFVMFCLYEGDTGLLIDNESHFVKEGEYWFDSDDMDEQDRHQEQMISKPNKYWGFKYGTGFAGFNS